MYISLRQQELRTCQKIGYEFYCAELFAAKCKLKYSCESVIYFDFGSDIIEENCNFAYCFNITDIKSTVRNGRNQIILANWPDNKHIVCNVNNDIPVKIPSFPYVLLNQSVLYSCVIDVENYFLLETFAACHNTKSKLVMYFLVNTAFVNSLDNLTESLKFPILLNWTTLEQTLSIY